jgi:hypothetical protein
MKVLFFMSHAGQARNFESTLRGLAARGHSIHVAYDRMEKKNLPGVSDLADALVDEYEHLTSGPHPKLTKAEWSLAASRLRASLDYLRYLGPEFGEAPKLRRRAEKFAPPWFSRIVAKTPSSLHASLRDAIQRAERSRPIDGAVLEYLREQDPDVVLVTPFLEPGSFQVEFVRGANRLGIPTCLCVASWDNLTNKGLIHEQPDAVTVWNEAQREEAVRLHGVPAERVVVTGAVAYDHWFEWKPSRDRAEFARDVGLDPERPFVLYAGSSGFIAPDEASFVVEWARELERHGFGDAQVLARPHPSNPLVGTSPAQAELATIRSVALYPPAGANPTNVESRRDYFDSLYHCSAVVGVNTSAFLEAAILGRPVFPVPSDRGRDTQHGMLHYHHLLNAGGGLLHVAASWAEHVEQLRDALARPHPEGCVSERSRRFTEAFIRPHGLDEPATPRMLAAIEELARGAATKVPSAEPARAGLLGSAIAHAARRAVHAGRRRHRKVKRRAAPRRDKPAKAPKSRPVKA